MLTQETTNRIKNDEDWKLVQAHILESIATLDSLDGIDFSDKEKACIKAEGKKEAKKILEEILEPFFDKDEETIDSDHIGKKTGVV